MDPVDAAPTGTRRLVSVCVPVAAVRPQVFLRFVQGQARGFWARGAEWVAHVGITDQIRLDGAAGPEGRYLAAWNRATELRPNPLYSLDADQRAHRPPRFYGGLAFREDHMPAGAWSRFPSGLFILPRFELEGGEAGYRLRAHREVGDWEDDARVEALLLEELETLARTLEEAGAETATEPPSAGDPDALGPAPAPGARAAWDGVVGDALNAIQEERFSKVVLARTLDVAPAEPLDPVEVLLHLWSDNPRAHVYLFEHEPGAVLLGAAPETVATVYGQDFHATAVAGSVPHGDTPEETAALAARLLASAKDQLEHEIAVRDMVARLEDLALEVGSEWEPHVITLSRIQHLETRIRARLPESCTVLDALEALHPTPAVCGLPRDAALGFIHDEEPFERGWYAGPVGWFDLDGSGVFAPALRSAVCHRGVWRLFAGAGIVAGSRPELEWEETGIKFEPVLRALAASQPG